jgi:hypothetical protein
MTSRSATSNLQVVPWFWTSPGVAYLTRSLLFCHFPDSSFRHHHRTFDISTGPSSLPIAFVGGIFRRRTSGVYNLCLCSYKWDISTKGHSTWCQTHSSCPGQMVWKSGQDSGRSPEARERLPWYSFRFMHFMFALYSCLKRLMLNGSLQCI